MVNTITIECPHCKKSFEVLLSNNASMVILGCPSCAVPLLHYKTRCFMLNRSQIDRLSKSRRDATVLKILRCIEHERSTANSSQRTSGAVAFSSCGRQRLGPPSSSTPPNENYITRDDIINLRIELETCVDSGRFIEKL